MSLPKRIFRIDVKHPKRYISGTPKRTFVQEKQALAAVETLRQKNPDAVVTLYETTSAWKQIDPEPELGQKNLLADKT